MTITVFLLDDHEVVRRGLRELLEAEPDIEVVGESGSAAEATRRIPALRPDVAVLDGRLPDGSGVDVRLIFRHEMVGRARGADRRSGDRHDREFLRRELLADVA